MEDLISVNITTYNRADRLIKAVESVQNQSYENLEIIIVDDYSTDYTEKVVKDLIKSDNRIKYIRHNKNRGNAHARNTAWKNSSGKYIAFLDDDDQWIDNRKLEKQVNIFKKSNENLGIICTSVRLYSSSKDYIVKSVKKPKYIRNHILAGNRDIYSPTVMTTKKIIEKVGFDVKIPRGIDSEFYRSCIVKYGYDVFYMSDTTTSIHEYGTDRLTTNQDFKKVIKVNLYLLNKYFFYFLVSPKPLLIRIRNIVKATFRIK